MTDERIFKDAAALDEATDRVIREMTQVDDVSEAAVRRVMARVRAADGTSAVEETRGGGWFGALLAPRVSWGLLAATASLAAFVGAGLTLVALRDSGGPPNPTAPVATVIKHATPNAAAGAPGDSVGAAMVMTPDEDPPKARQVAATSLPAPQDVRLDVTITDQSGGAKPITKTVSLIVADRETGSVRSETRVPFPQRPAPAGSPVTIVGFDWETLPLNVNVWPTIMADGHVRVKLALNYRTAGVTTDGGNTPRSTAVITKELTAVLSDAKPLVISTSADAATDRKVTVELKATIQK